MKLKYLVPNFFTACSFISAVFALIYAIQNDFLVTGWLIAVSIICDGLDGKLARLLNASTEFGRIFDTLSDFFAFGIVPAVLAYICVLQKFAIGGIIAALIFILGGAYRLTRFMRKATDPRKKKPFTGLPIPAAAGFIASFLILNYHLWQKVKSPIAFLALMLFTSFLMVSKIRYYSFELNYHKHRFFLTISILCALILFIFYPYYTYFLIILLYIFHGLIIHFRIIR
jgi:CDP-diacylglycerol--serine O-phosphatidyltransferase